MAEPAKIKAAADRLKKIIVARPEEGCMTKSVVGEMVDGFNCRITDGEFEFVADVPVAMGGDNAGPNAGTLARAGLAACLIGGYASFFAQRNI